MHKAIPKRKAVPQDNAALFIAASMFIGIFAVIYFGSKTLVSIMLITRIYAGVAVVLSLIPRRFFPLKIRIRKYLKSLLVVAGISPLVTALILALNFFISIEQKTETVFVKGMHLYDSSTLLEVKLESGKYEEHQQIRRFTVDRAPTMPDAVEYKVSKGIFGMTVIKDKKLVYDIEF